MRYKIQIYILETNYYFFKIIEFIKNLKFSNLLYNSEIFIDQKDTNFKVRI